MRALSFRFCPLPGRGHGYLPRPFPRGRPRSDLQPNYRNYFAEIQHPGDLFLDPDTGIATGTPSARHVAPSEIETLLTGTNRLVAVYQHVRAQRVPDRVDAVCAAVAATAPKVHWCSYESGTVAMVRGDN